MISVWLIEDSRIYRRGLARAIAGAEGMRCAGEFATAEDALSSLDEQEPAPEVVLLDVGLPGMNGLEALRELRRRSPQTKVVVLTVFNDADKVFQAVRAGANGYLLKSGPTEAVVAAVRQAAQGGAPLTPEVASRVLAFFSQMPVEPQEAGGAYGLTAREKEVLERLAEGLGTKEIAARLEVSGHTVIAHLRNIYTKLHVNTNTGAVAKAIRERLI